MLHYSLSFSSTSIVLGYLIQVLASTKFIVLGQLIFSTYNWRHLWETSLNLHTFKENAKRMSSKEGFMSSHPER